MSAADSSSETPFWSLAGIREGVRMGLPVTPGVMAFGLVVGAAAERAGVTFLQSTAMNVFICSGIAQLVALEIWPHQFTWAAIAGLGLLTAVIGARLFLMSVSMREWFGRLPRWQAYVALYYLTDANWLIAVRYRADRGRDVSVYAGATAAIVGAWLIATALGYWLGGFVVDPKIYGLDLVMPAFFAAMLVPLWSGPRRTVGWIVAGLVAVVVQHLVPGWWFIIVGSVVGALAGGYFDEVSE